MHKTLVSLLALLSCLPLVMAEDAAPRTRNVVIVVIDGPRLSETWADPTRALIPRMNKELAPKGVLYTDFRNDGITVTEPGHTAITTGVYQSKNNSGHELPFHENMFQRFRAAWSLPATAAWLVTGKDKLWTLSDTTDENWQGKWLPKMDCGKDGLGGPKKRTGYRDDQATFTKTLEVIAKERPRLLLVNLLGPDSTGHSGKWDDYRKAITECDDLATKIWETLQADPWYKDSTALFITNDHGRHLDGVEDGFRNHGCKCEGCRSLSCLALGPDFKVGALGGRRRGQIDLSVTVAAILGFRLPASKGEVMSELFPGNQLPKYPVSPSADSKGPASKE